MKCATKRYTINCTEWTGLKKYMSYREKQLVVLFSAEKSRIRIELMVQILIGMSGITQPTFFSRRSFYIFCRLATYFFLGGGGGMSENFSFSAQQCFKCSWLKLITHITRNTQFHRKLLDFRLVNFKP